MARADPRGEREARLGSRERTAPGTPTRRSWSRCGFSRDRRGAAAPPNVKPTIGITLDGTRRDAAYVSGSGTQTLRFEHTS